MHTLSDTLFNEITALLGELDSDGGLITPSIYETAQVLRSFPAASLGATTVEWLLRQQRADGGWGDPAAPLYRTAPTVAALLALQAQRTGSREHHAAIAAGVDAFRRQVAHWRPPLPDDIPVAVELILPRLLDEATRAGLELPTGAFAALRRLGEQRRHLIDRMPHRAATPPIHAWETWGRRPDRNVLDGSGGVGHSPAATAWWLHLAAHRRHLVPACQEARAYLAAAARATGAGWPGVMPSPWPLHRFERVFVLHTLLLSGLLHDARLAGAVRPHLQHLATVMGGQGIGFSQFFMPDGDDTAAAVALLAAMGRREFVTALTPFQHEDHFRAFPFELHHAPTVTARGATALTLCGVDSRPWRRALAASQLPDGRWVGDKWNRSWLYATAVVLDALAGRDDPAPVQAALHALITYQRADGGWGSGAATSVQESAYAVLALNTLRRAGEWHDAAESCWQRARGFLLANAEHRDRLPEALWIDKELYTPIRVDRAFLLSALLLVLQPTPALVPGEVEQIGVVDYA